jgi:anaerobic magnesium-protoporphyrin IX monomethyl ester cyclase
MNTIIIALYPYKAIGLDTWHDHGAGMTYTSCIKSGTPVGFMSMDRLNNDDELIELIKDYDTVAISMKSSYYAIGMKVIEYAKALGLKTIVGGYHVTAAPNELIENPDIDWIFDGESEITFPQFLRDPESFPRIIKGERITNLDSLPFMSRDIWNRPTEDVIGWWYGNVHRNMASVVSSRGCPYKCRFCQPIEDNHFGKKLRRRSVDSLIEELLWLKKQYHPDCVMIHDDTFMIQRKWLEEFIEKYPKVGLPFWASARADNICNNPDMTKRLIKVGWELVSIGLETGSQRILDLIDKGTTVEQNYESTKIVKESGARIYGNYMVGFPDESRDEVQMTAKMIDEINAEMTCWAYFTPYPGNYMGEEIIADGRSLLDRTTYDRMPKGKKVKGVDYAYLDAVVSGLRYRLHSRLFDIIIPTYENEDLTVACINSIKQHTDKEKYRIILVDNGSKSTSVVEDVLSDVESILHKFPTNKGFVEAINKGLEYSNAPYVCLLNNDTVVTSGWLNKLLNALHSDPQMGIVGPLTGFAQHHGPDSQHSLTLHEGIIPDRKARFWTIDEINSYLEIHHAGETKPAEFVAFLCALIKREVINKVGLLDTNYDMGMWDDVDYCMQAQRLGYKTAFALDTCIYHRGRSTFRLLEGKNLLNIEEMLKKNKRYLDAKMNAPVIIRAAKGKSSMRMV